MARSKPPSSSLLWKLLLQLTHPGSLSIDNTLAPAHSSFPRATTSRKDDGSRFMDFKRRKPVISCFTTG